MSSHTAGVTATSDASEPLLAGPLSFILDGGNLRDIRLYGTEVLRGISYLVRDQDWGTCPAVLTDVQQEQTPDGVVLRYHASCRKGAQSLRYACTIAAGNDGALTVTAVCTPDTDFLTCRTGFVVLHPLANTAGLPLAVTHTDGTETRGTFPAAISPGQPFFKIRSLTHEPLPGITATVTLAGNVFEMEDQRNWMDASYKTYVGSLLDPWPYTLKAGEAFQQSITLSFRGTPSASARGPVGLNSSSPVLVTLGAPKGPMPELALGVSMTEASATLEQAGVLRSHLHPAHLVIQVNPRVAPLGPSAQVAAALKAVTGAALCAEIVLPAEAPAHQELATIRSALDAAGFVPDAVMITQQHDLKSFQPTAPRPWGPSFTEMADAVRHHFPGTRCGGGMASYFTELNRKPPPKGLFDFVTHTVCPIVHAADDFAVMQCLETLPHIFSSARTLIGNAPYHLGPSGIAARDNPYGSSTAANPDGARICLADQDPRHQQLFGAAWTLGLIAAAADAGLASVALSDVTGPRGLIVGGRPVPAFHVFAGLSAAAGSQVLTCEVSAPSAVACLALRDPAGTHLWLANLTPTPQTIGLPPLPAAHAQVLDEAAWADAGGNLGWFAAAAPVDVTGGRLTLMPYAVAHVSNAPAVCT